MCMRRGFAAAIVSVVLLVGGALGDQPRHEIRFPDVPGYRTLKCDLHMHTVFSDGDVWPSTRVLEAWREGLPPALGPHLRRRGLTHFRQHDSRASLLTMTCARVIGLGTTWLRVPPARSCLPAGLPWPAAGLPRQVRVLHSGEQPLDRKASMILAGLRASLSGSDSSAV